MLICSNYWVTLKTNFQLYNILKGWTGAIKNGKYKLPKVNQSRGIVISLKSSKGLKLVFSPQNRIKTVLEIFVIRQQIRPNLVKSKCDFDTTLDLK